MLGHYSKGNIIITVYQSSHVGSLTGQSKASLNSRELAMVPLSEKYVSFWHRTHIYREKLQVKILTKILNGFGAWGSLYILSIAASFLVLLHQKVEYETKNNFSLANASSPGSIGSGLASSCFFHAWKAAFNPPASAIFSPSVSSPLTWIGSESGPGIVNLEYWSTKQEVRSLNASMVLLSHQFV